MKYQSQYKMPELTGWFAGRALGISQGIMEIARQQCTSNSGFGHEFKIEHIDHRSKRVERRISSDLSAPTVKF